MELQLTAVGSSSEIRDDNTRQTRVKPMIAYDMTERNGIWLQFDLGGIADKSKRQSIER